MGLDWCVEPQTIEGFEKTFSDLVEKQHALRLAIDEAYEGWLSEKGLKPPSIFPNPVLEEWQNTAGKALLEDLRSTEKQIANCQISPMETLGVPRVSLEMVPDVEEHARGVYNSHVEAAQKRLEQEPTDKYAAQARKRADTFMKENPSFEAWVQNNLGAFLSDYLTSENTPGYGKIVGMIAPQTSFRGKVVGYLMFLSGEVRNSAYESKSPEELLEYGRQILAEVETAESVKNGKPLKDDLDTARAAGEWCVFWGSRGHGMYAWY